MSSPKTITIVAATGNQGGAVAKVFLDLPGWNVRCLTRRTSSEKALALKALGAEVVQADLGDSNSMVEAFKGAHAVFVNTDFWLPYMNALAKGHGQDASRTLAYNTEVQHAKNAAIAASKTPTLERYVYSALGPMKAASGGKYSQSYHWDTKADSVNFIETELPELAKKTSYIYLGAYSTNPFLFPKLDEETGEYSLALPAPRETRFPIIDAENSTGPFVRALVEDEAAGTKLLAYDSSLTIGEAIDAWSGVTGKKADFLQLSVDEMHELTGLPYEILHGPAFIGEFGYMAGVEGVITPEQLKTKVKTTTYAEFLESKSLEYLLNLKFEKWIKE
ncbi:related to nitrogen metabolic regulation protein nmr [Cephalotrichum gorgonifer]|uniref:Related to nitrogen metabolic regulation protein nmr n=1 Tax=Cephalotrichum gorgonifer TaxID=2041049 RepID=A0AAE8N4C9_9PEZI|nr:related to nitrogen metabolic regulation protein nmr [Cephalotrichum gorgonifer]